MKIKRHNPQASRYLCVQKGSDIQRVRTAVADRMASEEGYKYIPRNIWKERVRDKV